TYQVWVRGYGLSDSAKTAATPGKVVNLKATIAPDDRTAAQLYPANYWFSMLNVPKNTEFPISEPGAASGANPMSYFRQLKTDGCISCHQIGNMPTRTLGAGTLAEHQKAWQDRVKFGPDASQMDQQFGSLGRDDFSKRMADWTQRVLKGEYPAAKPERP